jgi:nitroreductase/NAD-dependent dihydropyrimidine dehydrogenase PreA subunit
MLDFRVDAELCTRCGSCVLDCPVRIIEQEGDAPPFILPENERSCMRCQHCLAVCPTGALSILGRLPADSFALTAEELPSLGQMERLVRGRRSLRHYHEEDVDGALIERLLRAVANAPTGVNRMELSLRVISRREDLLRLRAKVHAELLAAETAGSLPERAKYLARSARVFREEGRDVIFRGAPHALIVSAPPDAPCPEQDVALALAYFELLAQSAGLGTVWWGMLRTALEALPHLKPLVGLPPDHVYYAMLFGKPTFQYARTVQRDDGAVIVPTSVA